MKDLLKLTRLILLAVLLAIATLGSPVAALGFSPALMLFAHDGQNQARLTYDGGFSLVFGYDTAIASSAHEARQTAGTTDLFGKSAEFLGTEERSVQVFRAVDQDELPSVLNGTYGSSPSASGKYFALTQEGAQNIANSTMNAGQQMTITSTTIHQSVFNQGYLFNDAGGAGASIHFQQEFLPTLYNSMSPIQFH